MGVDEQMICVLAVGDARAFLRIFPDEDPNRPAFARGRRYALEHVGVVPGALRDALSDVGAALSRSDAVTLAALVTALANTTGRSITPYKTWPAGYRPPRPWRGLRFEMLSVVVDDPPDLELIDCIAPDTPRVAIKRELVSRDELGAHVEAWTRAGVVSEVADAESGPHCVLLGARGEEELRAAVAAQAELSARGHDGVAAARRLGELLGYPSCCVDAFAMLRRGDDFTAALVLIPPLPHGPYSPLTAWLNPQLRVLSHFPCSPDCRESRHRASQVLAGGERARPGITDAWRALAARLHVVDEKGRFLAAIAEAAPSDGLELHDVLELVWPSESLPAMVRVPDLEGVELGRAAGRVVARAGGRDFRPVLVADHRGPDDGP